MKKVVMLAPPYHSIPPLTGAAVETWIDQVSKKIIKYQIHIISRSDEYLPLKEFKEGVYYHRIHMSKIYKRVFQKILGLDINSYNKRIFNIIKKIDPDIVHIHNYFDSKELIEWIRKYNKNIKIILHMHNENNNFKKNKFPYVDAFIGCSNYIVNIYKKLINSKKFYTVYNGVDINKFKKIKLIKERYSKDNYKNICYFGRISPEKGVDKFINIASLLKNKKYNFYLFGEISKNGDRKKYYDNLLKKVKKEKLNVKFFDSVSPNKVYMAYNIADIIIVPSKFNEPFGMVIIEAMSCQIPVIVAYKGGIKDYIKDEAIVIKNYDNFENESVKAIKKIINDENYKDTLVKKAYDMVKNRFDWINIALDIEKVYDEII